MLTSSNTTSLACLHGGRVLRADDSWDSAPLHINGPTLGEPATRGKWLDASGLLVLPGLVDFHGDAFERQIMPRPGVRFPLELALLDTDRQLAANGITTALHGITYSWESGLRGREMAYELFATFERLHRHLQVNHRIHLRFECHNTEGEQDVHAWLQTGRISLLAFNDHLPGMRRKAHKLHEYAERAGITNQEFLSLMDAASARAGEMPRVIERLAQHARRQSVPMASHDDDSVEQRTYYQNMKCRIAEFPLTRAVAQCARDCNADVVCGAPNVVRGGSHVGAMSASELIEEGLCTILASDYYYPSMLSAACTLVNKGLLSMPAAWALVSKNPARALGLDDRGSLSNGMRADLVLIDAESLALPRIIATVSAGKIVYLAEGERLHG